MSEKWNPEEETLEEYKARTGKNGKKEININVNTKQGWKEQAIERQIEHYMNKAKGLGLEPETPESYEDMNELVRSIHNAEKAELTSKRQALAKAGSEAGTKSVGQASLSAEDATGEKAGTSSSYPYFGDIPCSMREYPSVNAMLTDLRKEANDPSAAYQKEAKELLVEYFRKHAGSKEPLSAELQNVSDVARGKEAKWKIKRKGEK